MTLSAGSGIAGGSIGKRIGTPPSVPSTAAAAAGGGGGGGGAKDGGAGAGAGVAVLSAEEQEQLAEDVNHLFHVRMYVRYSFYEQSLITDLLARHVCS